MTFLSSFCEFWASPIFLTLPGEDTRLDLMTSGEVAENFGSSCSQNIKNRSSIEAGWARKSSELEQHELPIRGAINRRLVGLAIEVGDLANPDPGEEEILHDSCLCEICRT